MKKILMVMVLTMVLAASILVTPVIAKSFGGDITLTKKTSVSDIMASPDDYVGKRVLVEGVIVEVCAKRGCWVYVAGEKPFEKIKVKVTDGEIVFPMEARGKVGTIEGIVEKMVMTRDEMLKKGKHHAEEQGKRFDQATVLGGGTVYRIRGLGADIPGI